jgi:hypothetical protein
VTVNAKVDYTLLDRWRHSQAWRTRRRVHEETASAARAESSCSDPSLRDEPDRSPARVVHMPLAD